MNIFNDQWIPYNHSCAKDFWNAHCCCQVCFLLFVSNLERTEKGKGVTWLLICIISLPFSLRWLSVRVSRAFPDRWLQQWLGINAQPVAHASIASAFVSLIALWSTEPDHAQPAPPHHTSQWHALPHEIWCLVNKHCSSPALCTVEMDFYQPCNPAGQPKTISNLQWQYASPKCRNIGILA